jgi:hypothetical protein
MNEFLENRIQERSATVLNSRIEAALKYLKIEKSELDKILFEMGIDEPEIGLEILDSPTTSFDDFYGAVAKVHVEGAAIPVPRLKLAWASLAEQKQEKPAPTKPSSDNIAELLKTFKPVGGYSDIELLEAYGKDSLPEVEDVLKKRCKDRPCIVFLEDGKVDVENSLYMLRKARHQETPSTFVICGEMKQIYKVGEFPLDVFFECPIHNNVLLIDGYCEECGTTYDTKDIDRLTFLRLVKENIPTETPRLYRELKFDTLSQTFPKIFLKFKQLKDEDKLPSLKRRISKSRENDPFRVSSHKTY